MYTFEFIFMKHNRKKWIFLYLIALFLIFPLLSILLATNNNYSPKGSIKNILTSIVTQHQFPNITIQKSALIKGEKITATFKAKTNYLGIITIPFNTQYKNIDDRIIFRMKEQNQDKWWVENSYDVTQFLNEIPYQFGFAVIPDSSGKTYTFEIESTNGIAGNSILLAKKYPNFYSEYIYSKNLLLKNPSILLQFIMLKVEGIITHISLMKIILLCIIFLIPPVFYFFISRGYRLPKLLKIFTYILNGLLLIMITHLALASLAEITYLYPREYRDGALIDIANQFKIGANPYTLKNSLPHSYLYGLGAPLLDGIISKIFRSDPAITQHLISFVFVLLICYLVAKEIYQVTKNSMLTLTSLVVVLLYNGVTFRPEPLVMFTTLASLYLVNHTKTLNLRSIIFLTLSVLIAFYTKQYFVLLLPALILYFLFNQSKKNLIFLLIISSVCALLSISLVNRIFPMYFIEAVINNVNYSGGPYRWVVHPWDYMLNQSFTFFKSNWLLCLLFIIPTGIGLLKNMVIRFNLTDLNKPLYSFPATPLNNIYFIYALTSIFFLTFILGENGGAYLSYYHQLLTIPFYIFGISSLYPILKKYRWRQIVYIIFVLVFIFEYSPNLTFTTSNSSTDRQVWEEAITRIKKHDPNRVFLSPLFVIEEVKNNWPIYDNGHSEYYFQNEVNINSQLFDTRSPLLLETGPFLEKWQKALNEKITHKQFSLIVRPWGYNKQIDFDLLHQNYDLTYMMDLPIPSVSTIEFWEPKENYENN